MNGIIRMTAAVNKVNCANPGDCLEEMLQQLAELSGQGCEIVVFPKLALSSPSCGNLFLGNGLLDQCEKALDRLTAATAHMDCYLIAGLPVEDLGRVVSAMAVLYKGELVALIPTAENRPPFLNSAYSDNLVPPQTVFSCGRLRFCVMGCDPLALPLHAGECACAGCDLIIVPAYEPVHAGYVEKACAATQAVSEALGCAVAVVNGGVGDTSSPWVYEGFIEICECGEVATRVRASNFSERTSFSATVDLDVDIIRAHRRGIEGVSPSHSISPAVEKPGLLRRLRRNPWLPDERDYRRAPYLRELFDLQVRSLAARIENIGVTKLAIGASGGLDSTAALLVCAGVCDLLELPRKNIIGVTMPGFGTSNHTYYNALALLETLGATSRDVSIRAAVQQHFEDLAHEGERDAVYENAQARERAQVLFDIANQVGAVVVGTGDLSEAALGFCTFGGDQIANYNVNICIPKTVLQALVRHVAESGRIPECRELVEQILDTPISPELLPPEENGEIGQKTEHILGPYVLHDFFLYYFARCRLRPSKLYVYACAAFAGEFEPPYIADRLRLFLRRFCAGQFKRACAPDAAAVTEFTLGVADFYIPSDLDPTALLQELDGLGNL